MLLVKHFGVIFSTSFGMQSIEALPGTIITDWRNLISDRGVIIKFGRGIRRSTAHNEYLSSLKCPNKNPENVQIELQTTRQKVENPAPGIQTIPIVFKNSEKPPVDIN